MRRRPVRGFVMMPPHTVHPGCAVAISRSREYCMRAPRKKINRLPRLSLSQSIGNKRAVLFFVCAVALLASSDTHHG